MRVEVLLFDGFDEMDAFGPFEVLAGSALEIGLVSLGARASVTSQRGLEIGVAPVGAPDGVIVVGGGWQNRADRGAWGEAQRGDIPAFLRRFAERGGWTASVCTGAFLLGEAGLLRDRDATTNRGALQALEPYAGKVVDERVVDAGAVVTAQGLTAGLDLALRLVERELGTAAADARATALEYPRVGRTYFGT